MVSDTATDLKNSVSQLLSPSGLSPLGWFQIDGHPALLIGNIGSSHWAHFSNSSEHTDGLPDPMNRWTVGIISNLTDRLGPEIVDEVQYPFGEPNWPFQNYAKQALGIEQSPIGLLIHPTYGLWMAFRAVLVFSDRFSLPESGKRDRPCDTCSEKPCLNTCPIGAFTEQGYDYLSCKAHVASQPGRLCLEGGCLARQACPVGRNLIYEKPHQAFHMNAYI